MADLRDALLFLSGRDNLICFRQGKSERLFDQQVYITLGKLRRNREML